MGDVIERSFSVSLKLMKALCLYPPKNYKVLRYLFAGLTYFLWLIVAPSLTILNFAIQEELDLVQLNYNATFLAEAVCYSTKVLPFFLNGRRIQHCINYFGDPYFTEMCCRESQKRMMEKCITTCRKNSKIFLAVVTSGVLSYVLKPLFWDGYKFPVDMWLPFDATAKPVIYYPVYLFSACSCVYAATAGTSVDPVIGGLACHAVNQLRILKTNLQKLGKVLEKHKRNYRSRRRNFDVLYKKVQECIDHHNAILFFVKEFEECFSLAVFSQFVGSTVAICFCCLQLSIVDLISMNAVSCVIYIGIVGGQIYFYCHYGTKLYEENGSLATGIYMGQWYNYDTKCKKALITLMERSKRPMLVTAGNVLPLTLDTFTGVLKKAYSLVAVLKTYQ